MSIIKDLKKFKYWGKELKRVFIADLIRTILLSLLWISLGISLYVWFNNTGLLIYIILNLWMRWYLKDNESH